MTELRTLKCKFCGKEIIKNPKLSNKQWESRKHCSVICRQRERSRDMKGKQKGNDNPNWKGDNASNITTFHKRVEEVRGKPNYCLICGKTNENNTYDWACLTGKYEDINDYERLCRSCHKKYDLAKLGKGLITLKELPISKRDKEVISKIVMKLVNDNAIGRYSKIMKYQNKMPLEVLTGFSFGVIKEIQDIIIKILFDLTEEDLKDDKSKIERKEHDEQ